MNKGKNKNVIRVLAVICLVAVVALLAAMPLIAKQEPEEDGPKASILSGTVSAGEINTELIGGGTLVEDDAVTVSVPAAVKLEAFLVENGDRVTEGTAIAAVDRVSVMLAISQVQETLEYLSEQIEEAGDTEEEKTVTALAGGIVKILYAEEGDSVQSVMLEHGALAVLSLDGLMAVDLETESKLSAGTAVTVVLSDGTEVSGKIAKNLAGEMTVTLEDAGYAVDDTVQVTDEEGTVLGSGQLYIYSPWNATAYAGTVDTIKVSVGDELSAGKTIMVLGNVGYSAAYRQLIGQRQEYEELMLELFKMYQTETITAPCDGVVSGVDEDSVQLLSAGEESFTIQFLANSPNGNDTMIYTNYVGKVVAVAQNGWSLLVNPNPIEITDYTDLSGVPTTDDTLTWLCIHNLPESQNTTPEGRPGNSPQMGEGTVPPGDTTSQDVPMQTPGAPSVTQSGTVPVYELVNGAWEMISYQSVAAGDILLFAVDQEGEFVWIVRIKKAETAVPSIPGGTGSYPSGGNTGGYPSSGMGGSGYPSGGMSGGFPSGGMTEQEPAFELYGLDMAQIATVTPQNTMTMDITVDEQDVKSLQIGMTAQVRIDALGGEKYTATITQIGNTGTNNGGNSKYTVELTMERTGNMLSGMNATVTIVLSAVNDVLTIPADALVENGNQTVVYTGYDEENDMLINPVTVKVGSSDGETVEILEGLAKGQIYYYAYYDTLEISFTPEFGGGGFMFG